MGKPTIRFKGYTDDWEQRKVPELLKNSSSAMKIGPFGSALKKEYFVEEGVKVYAQENVFTGDFSIGSYYITEDKYKELQSCELYPGDLVISMMGTIGACAIFPENMEKGIMNSHLLRLQFDNEVVPKYIMYLLRDSDLIRKQIDRLSVGSIMSGLSSSVVKKLVFPIPRLAEQKKIIEYLDSLDKIITLHQRKCEETKKLKKFMLQKMFPKKGEKVPEIRFDDFTDDWEQRKVPELLKNSSSAMKIGPFGSALKKEYFVEEGVKVYAQENVFTGDFSIGSYYITEDKYKELQSCELYPGDLVISMMGTIGACAIFPENMEKGIMNSHLLRLQFDNEVVPKYIMYLLRDSDLIRKQIDRLSVGSIMSGLSSSVVKKLVFPIPRLAEQKKIIEYLDSLDKIITLHQHKCEELQNIKKFMLKNMFI